MQFHTEFQYDPAQDRRAAEQVSNGSSWKHGGPGRAAGLFSQHPGDVSSLPTDPRVGEVGGRPCSTVRTVRTQNTDFGVTISKFLILKLVLINMQ